MLSPVSKQKLKEPHTYNGTGDWKGYLRYFEQISERNQWSIHCIKKLNIYRITAQYDNLFLRCDHDVSIRYERVIVFPLHNNVRGALVSLRGIEATIVYHLWRYLLVKTDIAPLQPEVVGKLEN